MTEEISCHKSSNGYYQKGKGKINGTREVIK
jgi:hypothetical protein